MTAPMVTSDETESDAVPAARRNGKSQGATNARMGRETEQRVSRHLRQYWPESKRLVRTGYRNKHHVSPDEGDLHGLPFGVQVKGHGKGASQFVPGVVLAAIWDDANDQALAAGLPFAVIIEKRIGTVDVDAWFAWLPMRLSAALAICANLRGMEKVPSMSWMDISPYHYAGHGERLVRMNVCDFLALVRAAGVPMETVAQDDSLKTGV